MAQFVLRMWAQMPLARSVLAIVALLAAATVTTADPLARPGDLLLRQDLKLLVDEGVINLPVAAWPVPWGDVHEQLESADRSLLSASSLAAMQRLRASANWELDTGEYSLTAWVGATAEPRIIRTFEDTPREDAEAGLGYSWIGERFTINLSAAFANDPKDGDELRPDDTYVGVALGNWIVTAGWQQRWWGPGNDGSLILSTNARPAPGIAVQRNLSTPFETRWISWLGPWTLTSFMEQLDDERAVNDALLWGIRFGFRPHQSLEIGLSRTAQWCGDDRPCEFDTFVDVLRGKDNSGVNVAPEDEPGNQLGGIDIRWSLPRRVPAALYMQWIGEDGRPNGGFVGSWLRQAGAEFWGEIGGLSHRTHFEWAETICREGGFGFSDEKPNCAYGHPIYATGYRYNDRSIGHSLDGDGVSYSLGSTLVQSAGHSWNLALRYMEINSVGAPNPGHTLSPTPQDLVDIQLSHERQSRYGRFYFGLGYSDLDDVVNGNDRSELSGFVRWSTQ